MREPSAARSALSFSYSTRSCAACMSTSTSPSAILREDVDAVQLRECHTERLLVVLRAAACRHLLGGSLPSRRAASAQGSREGSTAAGCRQCAWGMEPRRRTRSSGSRGGRGRRARPRQGSRRAPAPPRETRSRESGGCRGSAPRAWRDAHSRPPASDRASGTGRRPRVVRGRARRGRRAARRSSAAGRARCGRSRTRTADPAGRASGWAAPPSPRASPAPRCA